MKPSADSPASTLTWPRARRWLLAILGVLSLVLAVFLIQSVLLHRALRRVEAHGGSIEALDAPALVRRLMGEDGCYAHSLREPPSWPVFRVYDEYALRRRCGVYFFRDPGNEGLATVRDLPCVVELDLPMASVSDTGLESLRGLARLRSLNLYGTHVTGPGLEHLRGFAELKTVRLSATALDDDGLAHLDDLPALEELGLSQTRVTGAGLAHLTRFRALRRLDLSGTAIDDQSLGFLHGLPLTHLDLHDTPVTDAALEHLEELAELKGIDLANTRVTDAGLESLKRLPRLSEVNLCGTQVTAHAARAMLGPIAHPCP
jgi:hypothetical protein